MFPFNIRVYGILINDAKQVLVSDEYIRGSYITKFPGGGLEFGEGTKACLEREFMEEMNLRVEAGEHIYTTDYFQRSAFDPRHQVISIYYKVYPKEAISIHLTEKPFDFDDAKMAIYASSGETETFRFVEWENFSGDTVTLPIDRIVADMIKMKF
jgi:ADP-ribose pyrophosphatase YjhB (NUDIX family)